MSQSDKIQNQSPCCVRAAASASNSLSSDCFAEFVWGRFRSRCSWCRVSSKGEDSRAGNRNGTSYLTAHSMMRTCEDLWLTPPPPRPPPATSCPPGLFFPRVPAALLHLFAGSLKRTLQHHSGHYLTAAIGAIHFWMAFFITVCGCCLSTSHCIHTLISLRCVQSPSSMVVLSAV